MSKFIRISLLILGILPSVFFTSCVTGKKPKSTPDATIIGASGPTARSDYDPSLSYRSKPTSYESFDPSQVDGDLNGSGLEMRDSSFNDMGGADSLIVGQFEDVYFNFDQSFVKESERPKVIEIAKHLNQNPDHRVIIEGHCDWKGTAEYNLALGDRRANSVKQFLLGLDIDASRIEILSKGDQEAVQGAGNSQRSKDRKAVFIIAKN